MFHFMLSLFRSPRRRRSSKAIPPRRRPFRPRVEVLEDRITPMIFTGLGDGTSWEDPNNWVNPANGKTGVPEATDGLATIPTGFLCILNKNGEDVNVTAVSNSGTLVVGNATLSTGSLSSSGALTINSVGKLEVTGTASVSGTTDVFGTFEAGTGASMALMSIGTVEASGNLQGGINSTTTFVGGSSWTVQPGGQLTDGQFIVNSGLTLNGSQTQVKNMVLNPTGTLSGPGSFQAWDQFLWQGGAINLGGGFTIEPTGTFTVTGGSPKNLYSVLTNDSPDTTFGGTGLVSIAPFLPGGTADLLNYQGTIDLSTDVSVGATGGTYGSFVNQVATIDVTGDATITGPFSSAVYGASGSILDIASGVTLTLAGNDALGGDISNSGTIAIPTHDTTTVANNLTYNGAAGSLLLVSGGTLAVSSAANLDSHGAIEVATEGTLSAQGPIDNYGTLTLDPGGTTFTASATLTNEGGLTVGGSGDLLNDSAAITNDATGTVTVSAGGRVLASGGWTNDGTLTDGGTMTVTGAMDNHGAIEVQSGGLLQDSGAFTNDATLTVDAGGLVGADSLDEAGSLLIQIASAGSYGVIAISGTVTFEDPNYLTVELVGGYNPSPGTQFAFLSYGSESGTVSQITSPDGNWTIIYDTHTAYLVAG